MGVELNHQKVADYAASVRKEYEANLKKLVDLASVSMEPERQAQVRATADRKSTRLNSSHRL